MLENNKNVIRKNGEIRVRQVRLIDQHGNQLGIKNTLEAVYLAQESGLDLVEIAPQSSPPVCKIMDYSKHVYQKSKRDKLNKNKAKALKIINFNYKIDDHDLDIKINQANKFLSNGNDVRIEIRFKGRESLHTDRMIDKMSLVRDRLVEAGNFSDPSVEKRSVTMSVSPKSIK